MNENKCPKCGCDMTLEDDRCDTDRGTMGGVVWICEVCDYQEEYEGEAPLEIEIDMEEADMNLSNILAKDRVEERGKEIREALG